MKNRHFLWSKKVKKDIFSGQFLHFYCLKKIGKNDTKIGQKIRKMKKPERRLFLGKKWHQIMIKEPFVFGRFPSFCLLTFSSM